MAVEENEEYAVDLPVQLANSYETIMLACGEILARKPTVVGFDTETSSSHAGNSHVSLIQIALVDVVYLLQVSGVADAIRDCGQTLRALLTSEQIIKVGVALHNDAMRIEAHLGIRMQGTIDLQHIAIARQLPMRSLADLASHLLGRNKLNSTDGNYDQNLSEMQIRYAATDAVLSLHVFHALFRLNVPKLAATTGVSDDETIDWLQKRAASGVGNPSTRSGWINVLVSSYGPWVKQLSYADRRHKAGEIVDRWLNSNR